MKDNYTIVGYNTNGAVEKIFETTDRVKATRKEVEFMGKYAYQQSFIQVNTCLSLDEV